MGLTDGVGVLLGDEIGQSGDPRAHAHGIIETMRREKIHWVAQQVNYAEAGQWMIWLREGVKIYGWGSVGSWAQGMDSTIEYNTAVAYGSKFHLANVESVAEDQEWSDLNLTRLADNMPEGVGVIFTETPWGRDSSKTVRWRQRGFVGMPEAIQSENPQATIPAMLDLARQLGWLARDTQPCVYLTKGYPAHHYTPTIDQTAGRWSLFRYGDIDPVDWSTVGSWPRPSGTTPIPPDPGDNMYAELERLVSLFRITSPNIAKAFDEVIKINKAQDVRLNAHQALLADFQENFEQMRDALA